MIWYIVNYSTKSIALGNELIRFAFIAKGQWEIEMKIKKNQLQKF